MKVVAVTLALVTLAGCSAEQRQRLNNAATYANEQEKLRQARRMPEPGECKSVLQPDNTWVTVCNQQQPPATLRCRVNGDYIYCN